MKELSIEEKAKAYDEAIKRASKLRVQNPFDTVSQMMEHVFPELKESEDEKVRKEILEVAKTVVSCDGTLYGKKYNCREWIAWLEKQGKKKEYTFKSIPRLLDMIEPSDKAKAYCQKLIDTLAKEGYNTDAKIVEGVLKGWNGEDVPMAVMDEKQGEQKPSTEVKPKFHEGDWIVDNIGAAHQIEKTVLNVTNNTFGYDIVGGGYFNDDSDVHLWTIQDAKDGDVLCAKYGNDEMPFIFTGKQGDVAYCALNSFGEFVLSIAEWLLKISVLPATKEQRDLLFSKMQEAGYMWNAENKELKKNEKKSQRMISAEAKNALYDKPTDNDIVEALRMEYEKGRADVLRCIDPDEMVADFYSQPLSKTRSLASIYRQGITDILRKINNNEENSITGTCSINDCGM